MRRGAARDGSGRSATLMISGVDISSAPDPSAPRQDFTALVDRLSAATLDPGTITAAPGILGVVARRIRPHWAIALACVRRRRVGHVFATGEDVGLRTAALFKLLRVRTPLVVACHNIATRWPTAYLQRLRVHTSVATFLCMSESQAEILQERCGGRARVELVYWHVDDQFFRPTDQPTDRLIASAGMARRDYATLVEATDGLDAELRIAADSPWFVSSLNVDPDEVPDHVEVRSYGTYANLRELYARARVVVVPLEDVDYAAGYSVILEAMAMGKPVIATRTRQPDDFIDEGVTGLRVAPYDVDGLRTALASLLDDPERAARMGAAGRRRVEELFALDRFVDRVAGAVVAT